jgi:hypothetical protein
MLVPAARPRRPCARRNASRNARDRDSGETQGLRIAPISGSTRASSERLSPRRVFIIRFPVPRFCLSTGSDGWPTWGTSVDVWRPTHALLACSSGDMHNGHSLNCESHTMGLDAYLRRFRLLPIHPDRGSRYDLPRRLPELGSPTVPSWPATRCCRGHRMTCRLNRNTITCWCTSWAHHFTCFALDKHADSHS